MSAPFREVMKAIALRAQAIADIDDQVSVADHPTMQVAGTTIVVGMPTLMEYNVTFGGFARYDVPVRVYVPSVSLEAAIDDLARYIAPTGDHSVKYAIENQGVDVSGVFSGDTWHESTVNVDRAEDFGSYTFGSVEYLGAQWVVELIAP